MDHTLGFGFDLSRVQTTGDNLPPLVIRKSRDDDIEAMLEIYQHHIARDVEQSAFREADLVHAEDIKRRRKNMRNKRLPHVVADENGRVVGFAFAVPFRKRPAYRYTLKHSIYVHHEKLRGGIGQKLLSALIDACAAEGFRQMIGYIDAANSASINLHNKLGFIEVGRLPSIGFKFGRWTDSVLVQRSLGPGATTLPDMATSESGRTPSSPDD